MKILTKEEEQEHYNATLKGGITGGTIGLLVVSIDFRFLHRIVQNHHTHDQFPSLYSYSNANTTSRAAAQSTQHPHVSQQSAT